MQNAQFLTIIRYLESGAVIHAEDSEDVSTFAGALKKWKKKQITPEFQKTFPQTHIAFNHFHVIKQINDKLDLVRRGITASLSEQQKKQSNGLRFIFFEE